MTLSIPSVAADLHCHTLASDHAYSTVTELARAASERGLLAIACTDHGVAVPDAPHLWHFHNLRLLPPYIRGVRVLSGVEANVVDFDGRLDMTDEDLDRLDVVVASMHGGLAPTGSTEEVSKAWTAIARNPRVDIIGHSGTPEFAYDYEAVIPLFGQTGKVVEINENSFAVRPRSAENCRRIALLCKRHGVRIAVDSDAHYHEAVGSVPNCLKMLEEIDFPPSLIVNGSKETLDAFLKEKKIAM